MGCDHVQIELIPFHFGQLDEPTRAEVERHLLSCTRCLADYLGLKRELETGGPAESPSPSSRARLRSAVAEELSRGRRWSWWERPLALGAAAVAVWGAVFVVQYVGTRPGLGPPGSPSHSGGP